MAGDAGGAAIVARFEPTMEEERIYARIVGKRQSRIAGEDLGWYSHLGAIPAGLLGGLAAVGLGVEGRFAARVSMLIGLAYILGQYAMHFLWRLYAARLAAAYRDGPKSRCVTIDASGVTLQWRQSSSFWAWEDITQLTREHDFLIFWIGPSNGVFLPRRALAAGEAEVLRMAKARISARPATQPSAGRRS
jgi:hypothetical protein